MRITLAHRAVLLLGMPATLLILSVIGLIQVVGGWGAGQHPTPAYWVALVGSALGAMILVGATFGPNAISTWHAHLLSKSPGVSSVPLRPRMRGGRGKRTSALGFRPRTVSADAHGLTIRGWSREPALSLPWSEIDSISGALRVDFDGVQRGVLLVRTEGGEPLELLPTPKWWSLKEASPELLEAYTARLTSRRG